MYLSYYSCNLKNVFFLTHFRNKNVAKLMRIIKHNKLFFALY